MNDQPSVRITCDDGNAHMARVEVLVGDEWQDISALVTRAVTVLQPGQPVTVSLELLPHLTLKAAGLLSSQTVGRLAEILHECGYKIIPPA